MASKKERILVPTYRMDLNGYYLLLRLQMELLKLKNVNGLGKEFLEPSTYKNHEKIMKSLAKRDLLEKTNTEIRVKEGLQDALRRILQSAHCMNFQNEGIQKKGQILSFYYADGRYVGVLLDKKETVLVTHEDAEAVYMAFKKIIEANVGASSFKAEEWKKLWNKEESITQPIRTAAIMHSSNHFARGRFSANLVADRTKIQIVRGNETTKFQELERDTTDISNWYGVVYKELQRLKDEHNAKNGIKSETAKKDKAPKKKTEYEQIIEQPKFPKSGIGFIFWTLKNMILGIPVMLKQLMKKKFVSVIMYVLWALLLFFYNMWATIYVNDTFDLSRRVVWGDITPYLMAGTLRTPNGIKGFNADWGRIDTTFLVWPLMMILTMIGRHLILQIKRRKLKFASDLGHIPANVSAFGKLKFGKGRAMWIAVAMTWVLGFVLMNPITIFLFSMFALLVFAQEGNFAIQFVMMWRCACGRKKIDAGLREQPDSRNYRMLFFHFSWGFAVYGIVSLFLWFLVDYNFWVRLAVTLLMLAFAVIQAFFPQLLAGKEAKQVVKNVVVFLVFCAVTYFFSSKMGIVFADDGGWTESGGWPGILYNAGFSTVFGMSIATIGFALGGPVALVVGGALLAGGVTFGIGLMDNEAGEYVRTSSRQFIMGTEDGEEKTFFCSTVETLDFIAGFMDPAAALGEGTLRTVFTGGKIATDVVSISKDIIGGGQDLYDAVNGGDAYDWFTVGWDALGLIFDNISFDADTKDFLGYVDDDLSDLMKIEDVLPENSDAIFSILDKGKSDIADNIHDNLTGGTSGGAGTSFESGGGTGISFETGGGAGVNFGGSDQYSQDIDSNVGENFTQNITEQSLETNIDSNTELPHKNEHSKPEPEPIPEPEPEEIPEETPEEILEEEIPEEETPEEALEEIPEETPEEILEEETPEETLEEIPEETPEEILEEEIPKEETPEETPEEIPEEETPEETLEEIPEETPEEILEEEIPKEETPEETPEEIPEEEIPKEETPEETPEEISEETPEEIEETPEEILEEETPEDKTES